MLTISILTILLFFCIFVLGYTKHKALLVCTVSLISLLLIEAGIFGYFLFLTYKGTCFFLIGNQTVLDQLIKTRLIYATYFAQGKKSFINQVDNTVGYTLGVNKTAGKYHTNGQGFRADREYSLVPRKDKLRLAAFGDSMVYCDGEINSETWPQLLEDSAGNLEVLNFGVPGYGFGQSYLRLLREGLKYNPDIIFFNYIQLGRRDRIDPQNFIVGGNLRNADLYRAEFKVEDGIVQTHAMTPYHLFDGAFKRKYLYEPLGIKDDHLVFKSNLFAKTNLGLLLKMLLVRKSMQSYGVQYAHNIPRDDETSVAMLANLISLAERSGASVVFFHPTSFSELPKGIQDLLNKHSSTVLYVNAVQTFLDEYSQRGLINQEEYVQLEKDFKNRGQEIDPPSLLTLFNAAEVRKKIINDEGHFNIRGNKIYSEAILSILKKRAWHRQDGAFQFNQSENSFVFSGN